MSTIKRLAMRRIVRRDRDRLGLPHSTHHGSFRQVLMSLDALDAFSDRHEVEDRAMEKAQDDVRWKRLGLRFPGAAS